MAIKTAAGRSAPKQLGELLDFCARRKRDLRIFVLPRDFVMIYGLEREFFPRYRLQWSSHRHVEFCLDGNYPVGASQHQKFVVVDDRLAFSGGFDLAQWRWDTLTHFPDDPRRRDPLGRGYRSFHDIQMAVTGDAARALGELARARWNGAEGCEPVPHAPDGRYDLWPEGLETAIADDPEKPIEPRELLHHIVGDAPLRARRYLKPVLLLGVVLALAAAWRFTPLSGYLNLETAEAAATWIESSPFSLLVLDRIWTGPAGVVEDVRVHATPLARIASGHLPLVAELQVADATPGEDLPAP